MGGRRTCDNAAGRIFRNVRILRLCRGCRGELLTDAFCSDSGFHSCHRLPLFYALNFGLDQYLFPYEAVYFLYIFITEKVTLRHIVPALAIRIVLTAIFLVLVAIPYWKCIDIL